ncbi:MAG TPA: hypothetical protein VMF67_11640 [Rhizomicrobium sp.]|nr:hypothetical protein [Rhizomicrobium sp.]
MADPADNAARDDRYVIADPAWFPEGFDPGRGEILFVATDRGQLAEQPFLDGRWDRARNPQTRISTRSLSSRLSHTQGEKRLIWHTGFCCSTLLAKALDRPGCNLSLCEPQILVDIAEARRTGALSRESAPAIAQFAFFLLSRPLAAGERITIKSSPAANSLLQHMTGGTTDPMLFLFSDCRSFLVSICKLGEDGRKYARRLFLALLADGHSQAQWPAGKLLSLSDLELAAIVWHMQIAEFRRALAGLPPGSAVSLDCDALLAAPEECLQRLDEFFALGIGTQALRDIVAGPLFRRNAKTGEDFFDASRRRAEHDNITKAMGRDLIRIVMQSYEICRTTPQTAPLPHPLVPLDKNYVL